MEQRFYCGIADNWKGPGMKLCKKDHPEVWTKLKGIDALRLWIMSYQRQENLSLYKFCNASKSLHAFSVFLRSKTEYSVSCQFVQTRKRVVPTKLLLFLDWSSLPAALKSN